MGFDARVKTVRLTSAKEGKQNSKGDIVGDKPSMLVIQLEVEEPKEDVVALLVRLARRPDDIKVELMSYQIEMISTAILQ